MFLNSRSQQRLLEGASQQEYRWARLPVGPTIAASFIYCKSLKLFPNLFEQTWKWKNKERKIVLLNRRTFQHHKKYTKKNKMVKIKFCEEDGGWMDMRVHIQTDCLLKWNGGQQWAGSFTLHPVLFIQLFAVVKRPSKKPDSSFFSDPSKCKQCPISIVLPLTHPFYYTNQENRRSDIMGTGNGLQLVQRPPTIGWPTEKSN